MTHNNSDQLLRYILTGELRPGQTLYVSESKYNDLISEQGFIKNITDWKEDQFGYDDFVVHGIKIVRSLDMDKQVEEAKKQQFS